MALVMFAISAVAAKADVIPVPGSDSPDGKLCAVMDVDRDPTIIPEGQGGDDPRIEITDKKTRRILISIGYFGTVGDDERPLREHVHVTWRQDSRAFGVAIDDRHFTSSEVYVLNKNAKFVSVDFPDYKTMTGFPEPTGDCGKSEGFTVEGWDSKGRLIYGIFYSAGPLFTGKDPLIHRVFLKVSATKMVVEKVEHEQGHWCRGDWIAEEKTAPAHARKRKPIHADRDGKASKAAAPSH